MPTYKLGEEQVAEVVVNHGHFRIRYGKIGGRELAGEVQILSVRNNIDNLSKGIYEVLAEATGLGRSMIEWVSNLPDADKDVLDHQSPLGKHVPQPMPKG